MNWIEVLNGTFGAQLFSAKNRPHHGLLGPNHRLKSLQLEAVYAED